MLSTLIILVVFGIILVLVETFVPGGILGTFGILTILGAIILTLVSDELDWSPGMRMVVAVGIVGVTTAAILLWLRFFAITIFRKTFTLTSESGKTAPKPNRPSQGDQGVALTELRPLGRAEFDGRRVDVRCQTGTAPVGTRLQVVGHEPGNLVVRTL
jgi:membrane-bound serine protease (ClpP class)